MGLKSISSGYVHLLRHLGFNNTFDERTTEGCGLENGNHRSPALRERVSGGRPGSA